MKLEEILELWDKDSYIDRNDLSEESLKISKLHAKYYRIYVNERLILKKYEAELKTLKLDKTEFYTQGPTKEQMELGWRLPAVGKILKSEINTYLEADKDIIKLSLKIGLQNEKVELLESIIKSFNSRGYNINAAIAFEKFKMGA